MSLRKVCLAAATGTVALALAACSSNSAAPQVAAASGGGNSSTSTSAASPQDLTHVWAQWAGCMRAHGVAMADPTLNSQNQPQFDFSQAKGVPESVKTAARQACQPIVANVAGNTNEQPSQAVLQQRVAYAKCVRAHGVPNFPDPDPVTGAFKLGGTGIDPQSAVAKQAQQACGQLKGGGS